MAVDYTEFDRDEITYLQRRDGKPSHALVPIDRWKQIEAILDALGHPEDPEDAMDIALMKARSSIGEPRRGMSLDIARRIHAGDHPVKAFRIARGLSQSELAERVGTTAQYVSQLETGNRTAKFSLLGKLANCLETDVDSLITTDMIGAAAVRQPHVDSSKDIVRFQVALSPRDARDAAISREALEDRLGTNFSHPEKQMLEAFEDLKDEIMEAVKRKLERGGLETDGLVLITSGDFNA